MARKNKNISRPDVGFGDYANENNEELNTQNNKDEKKNDAEVQKPKSKLAHLKESKPEKELASFHVDKELLKILNKESKKLGYGGKTKIVNLALKDFFEKEGLL